MVDDYAALFASSGEKGGSMLFYRPHEIEGTARADWRVEMPSGEIITCSLPPLTTIPVFYIENINDSNRVESFTCCGVYFKGICSCIYYSGDSCEVI